VKLVAVASTSRALNSVAFMGGPSRVHAGPVP
jgi:hypothetical protein